MDSSFEQNQRNQLQSDILNTIGHTSPDLGNDTPSQSRSPNLEKNKMSLEDEGNDLEEESDSDKTVENDDDNYKKAQSKKMYVIQEVEDEDAFSERSSYIRNNQSHHRKTLQ